MKKIMVGLIIFTLTLSVTASVRVITYNVLNFGGNDEDRLPFFETIFNDVDADLFLLQEIEDGIGGELLLSVINNGTNDFSGARYLNGPDTNNFLIYRNSLITFGSQDTIATDLRDISEFELIIDGNLIRFYSCHLKASEGYENERLEEVTKLRNHLSQLNEGSEFIIVGDMNFYTSSELAYQKFIADEGNNIGRAEDLSDQVGDWHENTNFAGVHTQSTRDSQFGGGASGGLDDRFDFIFSSYQLNNGAGIEYIDETITSFGNDGEHFNMSINDGTNSVVSPEVADALYEASDHLPVFADFNTIISSEPMIVVRIPNIEEEWQQGTEHIIEWVSSSFNDNVKIELQDETSEEREVLAASTENDGEWTWDIPLEQLLGDYKIVISDAVDGNPIDESNNPFHIIEPTTDYTIYEIQYSTTGPSPLEGVQVITYGIVTAVGDYGFFLQDGTGAWNGIFVYEYGTTISQGDEIDITATVAEYYDKTELADIEEYIVLTSGNLLPEAISLSTINVNQEDYEGVIVQVNNAECIDDSLGNGEWLVDDGSGEIIIGDLMYAFVPEIGEFYDIIGVVDYSYSSFKIEPRYSNDINITSSVQESIVNIDFDLYNYPNPFNPSTTIFFELTAKNAKNAKITIHNLKGQKVKNLSPSLCHPEFIEGQGETQYSVTWNGHDNNDQPVSSGIYFYKLISGDFKHTKKMLLLK